MFFSDNVGNPNNSVQITDIYPTDTIRLDGSVIIGRRSPFLSKIIP